MPTSQPVSGDPAWASVGEYMQTWAIAEAALDRAIGVALSLTPLQGLIVTAEIPFASKIKIAIAAIHASTLSIRARSTYIKELNQFLKLAPADRNTAAHRPFRLTADGKGTEFYFFALRGALENKSIVWTEDDLRQKCDRLHTIRGRLDELALKIGGVNLDTVWQRAYSYMPADQTTSGRPPLTLRDQGSPHTPESHNSDPANAKC
jgi:hypothetical protein